MVNPRTQNLLEGFINKPVGSLIISGTEHSGIDIVVNNIIEALLGDDSKNNIVLVEPEAGKKIGIDQIRGLKRALATSVSAKKSVGRVAVIKKSHLMTTEAQNGVLKLIEEPVNGAVLLLITTDKSSLLPTIRSRCQSIPILPITKNQAITYAEKENKDVDQLNKAFLISKGEYELFTELLDTNDNVLPESIQKAKTFLLKSIFNRLQLQKTYSDSEVLLDLLVNLERISESALHGAKKVNIYRWEKAIKTTKKCRELLDSNVIAKLVFLRLCLQL